MILLLIFYAFVFSSCSLFTPKTVILKIEGSDTMLSFTELLAKEYMRRNPHVAIYVSGGGSREGIDAVAGGTADIATASRMLTPDEIKTLADKYGSVGMSFLVAKDAISVYINPKNKVKNLSLDQLRKIFTCRINNWSELGGDEMPINLISRSPSSGTYSYFKQFVLAGEKYCGAASVEPSMNTMIDKIEDDKYAIGYGGIGLHDGIIHTAIDGIEPTVENVRNDSYPICRYLYFITLHNRQGPIKDFIDWALSHDAQRFIQQAGYVSIWKVSF